MPSTAGTKARLAGTVIHIDDKVRTITVETMGPWTGDTQSSLQRQTVRLADDTEVALVRRSPGAEWPGGFVPTAVEPGE